jgi:hypothetical protein
MLKIILIIFSLTPGGQATIMGRYEVKTLDECVVKATYVNSNPENPYNAACYPIETKANL